MININLHVAKSTLLHYMDMITLYDKGFDWMILEYFRILRSFSDCQTIQSKHLSIG